MKSRISVWIIGICVMAAIALAVPLNPEVYWGFVNVEGEPAAAGSVLTVATSSNERLANQTIPADPSYPGSYYIEIPFDDPHTQKDEGAVNNEPIVWRFNNISVISPQHDTAEIRKTNNNFTILAITNPDIICNVSYNDSSILLGEYINATVYLYNTGEGTANITILNPTSANIQTNLPQYTALAKEEEQEISVIMTPSACGNYTTNMQVNSYNLAGALVDTINNEISFAVEGYDISVESINASDSRVTVGEEITLAAIVSNKGSLKINGFNITFTDGINIIDSLTTNITIYSGENISVTLNWKPELGERTVKATAQIIGTECNINDNSKTSSKIYITSAQAQESDLGDDDNVNVNVNVSVNVPINIPPLNSANTTQQQPAVPENKLNATKEGNEITGMAIYSNFKDMLPQFVLMFILIFCLVSGYYWVKKGNVSLKEKLPIQEKKPEIKEEPKLRFIISKEAKKQEMQQKPAEIKEQIQKDFEVKPKKESVLKNIFERKQKEEKPAEIKSESKIEKGVKVWPRSAVFDKSIEVVKSKPVEAKPKVRSNRDSAWINMKSNIKSIIGLRSKEKPSVVIEPEEKQAINPSIEPVLPIEPIKPIPIKKPDNVPYDHLMHAITLIEQISKNKEPKSILLKKYGSKYPKEIIEMAGKYVFLNQGFDKEIDVMEELNKLGVLDKDYQEISAEKLEKAMDIIAKGYSSEK